MPRFTTGQILFGVLLAAVIGLLAAYRTGFLY
jgi:hypothetical protein